MTVVVFAGAGASKAVNPREYPTTVEFYQRLPDNVSNHVIFARITEYLKKRASSDAAIDVEQVLWALHELDTFLEAATDPESVPGWFLRGDRLVSFLGMSQNFSNLVEPAPKVREVLARLTDDINARVYDFYARSPEMHELETTWLALLEPLLLSDEPIELFTTNYDINIEVALEQLRLEGRLHQPIKTGRRPGVYQFLDELLWAPGPQDQLPRPAGLLTKLHGSVDWSRGPQGIYVGDPLYKGSHSKQVILYPGFKGVPTEEPFALFHHYLAGAVANASQILFIGFAFRDSYINEILSRFTATHARLFVIDPANELPKIPFAKTRVNHLKKPFGPESIPLMLNSLARTLPEAPGV